MNETEKPMILPQDAGSLQARVVELEKLARLMWISYHDGEPEFDTMGLCIEGGMEQEYFDARSWRELIEDRIKAYFKKGTWNVTGQHENGFIPVEEKLPPEGVDVEFMELHRGPRHGKQWVDCEEECAYRGITHWRPLPETTTAPAKEEISNEYF